MGEKQRGGCCVSLRSSNDYWGWSRLGPLNFESGTLACWHPEPSATNPNGGPL
jgi:hypothetical protein